MQKVYLVNHWGYVTFKSYAAAKKLADSIGGVVETQHIIPEEFDRMDKFNEFADDTVNTL